MGISSCEPIKNHKLKASIYILLIVILVVFGSLFESKDILQYPKHLESIWWHGFLVLVCAGILLIPLNLLIGYFKKSITDDDKRFFWYLSHIFCYFLATVVSPKQWPFWLAIGITWELFECYLSCYSNRLKPFISCSGMYDIVANIAGIFFAIYVRCQIYDTNSN